MQIGFALLESGSVREKNAANVLVKNLIDLFTGAIVFYLCGYGLMQDQQGGIIGNGRFFGIGLNNSDYTKWIFSFSFCASCTTLVSGSLAERTYMDTYVVYSMIMTGFIYPISAGWAWGGGWLQDLGFQDFAGSGIVHLIGGAAGFWGTKILGPRIGFFNQTHIEKHQEEQQNKPSQVKPIGQKFDEDSNISFCQSQELPMQRRVKIFKRELKEFEKMKDKIAKQMILIYDFNLTKKFQYSSMTNIVIGSLILWISWFFFNGSSGYSITNLNATNNPQKIVINTLLCGTVSALIVFFFKPYFMRKVSPVSNFNPANIINGLLAGHVAITAPCNNVEPYIAIVIGLLSGFWYIFSCWLLVKMKVDDPVDATQIHAFCGLLGLICVGLFDNDKGLIFTASAHQLGIQLIGAIALTFWTSLCSVPYFYIINKMKRLRVPAIYEVIGLDNMLHEESKKIKFISLSNQDSQQHSYHQNDKSQNFDYQGNNLDTLEMMRDVSQRVLDGIPFQLNTNFNQDQNSQHCHVNDINRFDAIN
eukprot:403365366